MESVFLLIMDFVGGRMLLNILVRMKIVIVIKKQSRSWQNFQTIQNNENPSNIVSINHVSHHEIKENRDHIKILLPAASYLGRQEQAFRGHDESNDRGNFVELVETMCPLTDPSVQLKINRRYGSFLSSECQNDLITIFGNSIRNDVANQVIIYLNLSIFLF